MVIGIDMGHGINCRGAAKYLDEVNENRKIGNRLIAMLREKGHTVVNCTNDAATNSNAQLAGIVSKANAQKLDQFVSIHLNAGGGRGTETYVYEGNYANKNNDLAVAKRVNDAVVASCNFFNRGVKQANYYVLRETVAPAILIEVCFVDSQEDAKKLNTENVARALFKGITGKDYVAPAANKPVANKPANNDNVTYRVVTGSFKDKKNAEAQVARLKKAGFDSFITTK